ncbi:MAG: sulfatase-like hydrolase/transferase [Clostridia bacterium]
MSEKINVLFITSDQQHFNTLGINNPEIKTPNLDRLCSMGTTFDRAYTVNPTCTPTRATMITGKYPSQHGAWTLGTKLDEKCTTIGDLMHEAGMKTSLVGKAHFQPLASTDEYTSLESYPTLQDLDFWKNFTDDFYGFDTIKLTRNHTNEAHVGQHYAIWLEEHGFTNWRDYFVEPTGTMDRSKKYIWDIPEELHYDAWIAEETNNLLEQYKKNDDQFMLWTSFFDPHPAYFAPKPWVDMYDPDKLTLPKLDPNELEKATEVHRLTQEEKPDYSKFRSSGYALHGCNSHVGASEEIQRKNLATYYAMVSLMDKYIGKILDKLDELDLTKNTVIVFTTDHGHYVGQHGLHAKGPFMFEDAIKVPYIVSLKDKIPAGVRSNALQSVVDIPVTFLDYCNIKMPYDWTGKNQREVWEGTKEKVRDHIICEHNHDRNTMNLRAYVDQKYKLVVMQNQTYGELYDLENDPNEVNNRFNDEDYKNIKSELMMKYIWAELEKESLFMPRIAHA